MISNLFYLIVFVRVHMSLMAWIKSSIQVRCKFQLTS